MKKLLLLVFTLICLRADAQYYLDNFESPNQIPLVIDSTTGNIWQIGAPHKLYFDTAYSRPNAIVTDTINYYPPNNQSTFTVNLSIFSWWFLRGVYFRFAHKFDTDSLHAGGYITSSYDGGATWEDIYHDQAIWSVYNFYSQNDTINGGIPAFSGNSRNGYTNSNGWVVSEISYGYCNYPINADSVMIRFNFQSDSTNNINKEGWMVDNIDVQFIVCEGIESFYSSKDDIEIIPNPSIATSVLQLNSSLTDATLIIYDMLGKEIMQKHLTDNKTEIKTSALEKGIYIVKVTGDNKFFTKKLIVQ